MSHGGKRPGAGRKKGTPNKRSEEVRQKLEEMDCDPIEGMVRIAIEAEALASSAENFAQKKDSLKLAGDMFKDLAKYYAPQLRAIDFTVTDPVELVQKIERKIVDPTTPDS